MKVSIALTKYNNLCMLFNDNGHIKEVVLQYDGSVICFYKANFFEEAGGRLPDYFSNRLDLQTKQPVSSKEYLKDDY